MNVEAWLAKADNKHSDDYDAKNDWKCNISELEATGFGGFGDFLINLEVGKGE